MPLRVAVMGCVVNGPGEAREADLGVASGNGKGQIFVKGEVIKTVPESQIVETLIEEAMRIAGEQVDAGDAVRPARRQRQLTDPASRPVLRTPDRPRPRRGATSPPSTGCWRPTRSPPACSPAGSRPPGTGAGVARRAAVGLRRRAAASRRSAWPAPT